MGSAQKETIDPLTMPMTRFANSVVDAVVDRVDIVRDDIARYFRSDLLFYRAGHPEGAGRARGAALGPRAVLGGGRARRAFHPGEGIMHVSQPEVRSTPRAGALPDDPWSVAALHVVTTLTGSALLALALHRGARDPDQVWNAAHVDEDWNAEQWGEDEEVVARRAARRGRFRRSVRDFARDEASG